MECTINWMGADGMSFIAETGSGHMINMDGAPDGGGRNLRAATDGNRVGRDWRLHRL